MSDQTLGDRTAIVTGGGSGIGQAISLRFARAGARVAVLDVGREAGEATVRKIEQGGGTAGFFACDVSQQAEVHRAFGAVAERLGEVNVLVNNAGIAHVGTVGNTTEADMDRLFAVNVKGVYNCLHAAVGGMAGRGGVILNVASVAASVGIPDRFAYSMTKGAVVSMTLSVACDYVGQGIRCNCISPGRVHTPFVDGFLRANYPGKETEVFARLARTQPIGRMGEPDEIAALALFLCSDDAAFITGSNFPIDGGFASLKP